MHQLVLYCTDLDYFPADIDHFIQQCQQMDLLAEPLNSKQNDHFFLGDRFMQYISFVGCSPFLKLKPETEHDNNFCQAMLSMPPSDIHFLSPHPSPIPRCPHCKKPLSQITKILDTWKTNKQNLAVDCQSCQVSTELYQLDWRRSAAFCRFYLAFSHIYPKEAIPSDGLINWLNDYSGQQWRYCYL